MLFTLIDFFLLKHSFKFYKNELYLKEFKRVKNEYTLEKMQKEKWTLKSKQILNNKIPFN